MSIHKATNYLKHNKVGFTTFINETIQSIKHTGALGVYAYLASKPENWNICKKHLQNHFNCGRDHINTCFNYLKKLGLIESKSVRNDKGQITHWETILHDRIHAKPIVVGDPDHNTENPHSGDFDEKSTIPVSNILDNKGSGKTAPTNKRDLQTKDRTNKRSIDRSSLSEKERNLNDLISKKLSNNTVTNKQLKDMLAKASFETISKSLDYAMADQNFHNKMSPIAYFITCILMQGYYPDPLASTYNKKPRKYVEVTQEISHASHKPHIPTSDAPEEAKTAFQRKGTQTIGEALELLKNRQG